MLKTWQLQKLESMEGWSDFCLTQSDLAAQKKQQLLEMARNGEPRPNCNNNPLGRVLVHYTISNGDCYDPQFDKEIRGLRPDWFVTRSEIASQKKQQLLKMAKAGAPRPIGQKHPLGQVLKFYTNPSSNCYDVQFDKQIRGLRPDWFATRSEIASQKKQQLLEMARNGEPKPALGTKLWSALQRYTCPVGNYDAVFAQKIKHLRPEWFRSEMVVKNKQQILEMARRGEPRPLQRKPLGSMLCSCTNQKDKGYDPKFDKQIRTLRPDWFIGQSEKAAQKKQQLIQIATKGEPRPVQKVHPLGILLGSLTQPNSPRYDPEFDRRIRDTRPDWFITDYRKQQLLDMARNGEPRPAAGRHPLGHALHGYTSSKKAYDPEFDQQIRKIRPDWFATRSEIASQKKQQLFEMARNGDPRPVVVKHALGSPLCCYTNPRTTSYDPEFDKQIRKLRPDWFRK